MAEEYKNNVLKNFKEDYVSAKKKFDATFAKDQFTEIDAKVMKTAILKASTILEKDFNLQNKIKGSHSAKILDQINNSNSKQR